MGLVMKRLMIPIVLLFALLLTGCPSPTVCPPPIVVTATPTALPPTPTPVAIRWDSRLSELGLYVLDMPGDWDLEAAWLTVAGDWATAPQWAKDLYPWNNLGGDRHAYGLAYTAAGNIQTDKGFRLSWPDGAAMVTADSSGHPYWANLPLQEGFDWAQTSGPYSWDTYGGDQVVGLGMPYPPLPWQPQASALGGVHVSFFAVWRQRPPQ